MLMSHGQAGALAYMEILESWLIVDLHPRLCPFLSIWLQGSLTCLSFVFYLEDGEIPRTCLGSPPQRHRTLKHERTCCSARTVSARVCYHCHSFGSRVMCLRPGLIISLPRQQLCILSLAQGRKLRH